MSEIVNAVIKKTQLGYESHGILSASLLLEWKGGGVWFGGYTLDAVPGNDRALGRRPHAACGAWVAGILKTVGVDNWEDLPGKFVRVKTAGWGSSIKVIGHLIEDKWFDADALMESLR